MCFVALTVLFVPIANHWNVGGHDPHIVAANGAFFDVYNRSLLTWFVAAHEALLPYMIELF